MKEQKKRYAIKADTLPKEVREKLSVKENDLVDIIIEDEQVVLKNQLQSGLEEISEIIGDTFKKLGVLTDRDAIQYAVDFRHGKV